MNNENEWKSARKARNNMCPMCIVLFESEPWCRDTEVSSHEVLKDAHNNTEGRLSTVLSRPERFQNISNVCHAVAGHRSISVVCLTT